MFRNMLNNMRNGKCTEDNWHVWKKRMMGIVPTSEIQSFESGLYMLPTNNEVDRVNNDGLAKLVDAGERVCRIEAVS